MALPNEFSSSAAPVVTGGSTERPNAPEGPATVPLQPRPIGLTVAHDRIGAVEVTAISRTWRPADVSRCRLCPRGKCVVDNNGNCLVLLPRHVDYRSAGLATLLPGWTDRIPGLRIEGDTNLS